MDDCHTTGHYVDWGPTYWRCGDICTSAVAPAKDCTCGTSRFSHNEGKWCCSTNCIGGGCRRWKPGHKEGDLPNHCAVWTPAVCPNGIALQLNQSCNGDCNYYGEDSRRNEVSSRSYVGACNNTSTCIKEGEGTTGTYRPTVCTGDSSCEGELDWCREEGRKEEKCPSGFTRCLRVGSNAEGGNATKSIPGQCINVKQWRDGESNHCLDRSDEDPFQEKVEKAIDFAKLKTCTDRDGYTGLECGGKEVCINMQSWCMDPTLVRQFPCPILGAGIYTITPRLCSNITFWRKQACGKYHSVRCQAGNSGQCVVPGAWGVEGSRQSCTDGSDKYRPIKQLAKEPSKADYKKQHSGGEPINTDEDHNVGEEGKPTEADKRAYGSKHSQPQVWKTAPTTEKYYYENYWGTELGAKFQKDRSTGLWMIPESDPFKVPSVTEEDLKEWARFYNRDDYMKDKATNRWMAWMTEENCKGFVCKVNNIVVLI